MIYDLFKSGFSIEFVLNLFARVFVMFCILPVHEFAHALVADRLGDKTARLSGRVTLNPLAHLDLFGALMMIVAGFGYAKPVPINMNNFKMKNRKLGTALTAFAGPFSNLILAFIFSVAYCAIFRFATPTKGSVLRAVAIFCLYVTQINVSLAVFNLIPIPPLDGSRIMTAILPDKTYFKLMQYERYFVYGLFIIIVLGVLDKPMAWVTTGVTGAIIKLAAAIFGLQVG